MLVAASVRSSGGILWQKNVGGTVRGDPRLVAAHACQARVCQACSYGRMWVAPLAAILDWVYCKCMRHGVTFVQ